VLIPPNHRNQGRFPPGNRPISLARQRRRPPGADTGQKEAQWAHGGFDSGARSSLLSLAVMGSISSQRKISLFPEGSHEAGPCTHTAEFAPGLGAKFSQIARAKVGQALPLQMTP